MRPFTPTILRREAREAQAEIQRKMLNAIIVTRAITNKNVGLQGEERKVKDRNRREREKLRQKRRKMTRRKSRVLLPLQKRKAKRKKLKRRGWQ